MNGNEKKHNSSLENSYKEFELWVLLQQTRDAVFNAREKELQKYGISQREAATLRAIVSIGKNVTPARLARWIYRKPHTVFSILQRMEKKNLLTLNKDPNIPNIVRIGLTRKGKKAYQASLHRETLFRIFHPLAGSRSNRLISDLNEIRDRALNETGDIIHRPFP